MVAYVPVKAVEIVFSFHQIPSLQELWGARGCGPTQLPALRQTAGGGAAQTAGGIAPHGWQRRDRNGKRRRTVAEGGGGGFVEDALHFQACNAACVLRRLHSLTALTHCTHLACTRSSPSGTPGSQLAARHQNPTKTVAHTESNRAPKPNTGCCPRSQLGLRYLGTALPPSQPLAGNRPGTAQQAAPGAVRR